MSREQTHRNRLRLFGGALALLLGAVLSIWAYSSQASSAVLSASPATAKQNDTVTLVGRGFQPGEMVAVWITYPDFSVFGVAEMETNADGAFTYPYLPDFLGASFTPTGRYTYTARGKSSGLEVYASIDVQMPVAPGTSTGVSLSATPGKDDQGSYFIFQGSGYSSNETLGLWMRNPDNSVTDLGQIQSGPAGALYYVLRMNGAAVGRYAFTGYGLSSGRTGIAEFDLTVSDLTVASQVGKLTVGPSAGQQRTYAQFDGSGFKPGEIVSIWVTLPDYSTLAIGDVKANSGGAFSVEMYLNERLPTGKHTFTAFGNLSRVRAIADYTLNPGGPEAATAPEVDAICDGSGCR